MCNISPIQRMQTAKYIAGMSITSSLHNNTWHKQLSIYTIYINHLNNYKLYILCLCCYIGIMQLLYLLNSPWFLSHFYLMKGEAMRVSHSRNIYNNLVVISQFYYSMQVRLLKNNMFNNNKLCQLYILE